MKVHYCKYCGQPLFTYEQESAPFYRDANGEVHGRTIRLKGECRNVTCGAWMVSGDVLELDQTVDTYLKAQASHA